MNIRFLFPELKMLCIQREKFPTDRRLLVKSLETQYAGFADSRCCKEKPWKAFQIKILLPLQPLINRQYLQGTCISFIKSCIQ